jgi:hypothetical protein
MGGFVTSEQIQYLAAEIVSQIQTQAEQSPSNVADIKLLLEEEHISF